LYFIFDDAFSQADFSTDSSLLVNYCIKNETVGKQGSGKSLKYQHQTILKLFLGVYKNALSKQISANCEFMPSCSSFAWRALDECGLLKALLLTADRLTRCNGNAQPETSPYLIRRQDAKIVDYPCQYMLAK
jgi:putative component of membrane protein insertase Oxa1/YidC/SpoIIIJ protein YidD